MNCDPTETYWGKMCILHIIRPKLHLSFFLFLSPQPLLPKLLPPQLQKQRLLPLRHHHHHLLQLQPPLPCLQSPQCQHRLPKPNLVCFHLNHLNLHAEGSVYLIRWEIRWNFINPLLGKLGIEQYVSEKATSTVFDSWCHILSQVSAVKPTAAAPAPAPPTAGGRGESRVTHMC